MLSKGLLAFLSLLLLGVAPLAADRRNTNPVTTEPTTVTTPVWNETHHTTDADIQNTQSTQYAETMTASEAEEAALAVVGLAREDVRFSRTEFDVERGAFVWEVEFHHETWEYDFTLDAIDGTVLAQSREQEPQINGNAQQTPVPQSPVVQNQPAEQTPAAETETSVLTAEEAAAIAFAHASLAAEDVTHLKTKQDRDDGVLVWEVEFRQGRTEYEYEIHAQTGKVLDWERDFDD